jgi:hypothetical protein
MPVARCAPLMLDQRPLSQARRAARTARAASWAEPSGTARLGASRACERRVETAACGIGLSAVDKHAIASRFGGYSDAENWPHAAFNLIDAELE